MSEAVSVAPMVALWLPYPPTANNLFLNARKGRVPTPEYQAWQFEAGLRIKRQRPDPIVGAFRCDMVFNRPDNRCRDLGNLEKAPMDALVAAQVILDDSLCVDLRLRWSSMPPRKPGSCMILLEGLG